MAETLKGKQLETTHNGLGLQSKGQVQRGFRKSQNAEAASLHWLEFAEAEKRGRTEP
jgi:hypothetical protein